MACALRVEQCGESERTGEGTRGPSSVGSLGAWWIGQHETRQPCRVLELGARVPNLGGPSLSSARVRGRGQPRPRICERGQADLWRTDASCCGLSGSRSKSHRSARGASSRGHWWRGRSGDVRADVCGCECSTPARRCVFVAGPFWRRRWWRCCCSVVDRSGGRWRVHCWALSFSLLRGRGAEEPRSAVDARDVSRGVLTCDVRGDCLPVTCVTLRTVDCDQSIECVDYRQANRR